MKDFLYPLLSILILTMAACSNASPSPALSLHEQTQSLDAIEGKAAPSC